MTDAKELAEAREIIANGCGCHRECERLVDEPCGCAEDAKAVLALRAPANVGDERAKLREVLKQIANFGEEKDEWDAVNRYEIVRNLAHGVLAETDPSRPEITGGDTAKPYYCPKCKRHKRDGDCAEQYCPMAAPSITGGE